MNDNIKRLQEQIEAEKRKISNCKHDFDKAFYNAETVREPYGYRMVGQGSDVWLYRDWETDRKSTRLNSSHSAKSRMPSSA